MQKHKTEVVFIITNCNSSGDNYCKWHLINGDNETWHGEEEEEKDEHEKEDEIIIIIINKEKKAEREIPVIS